MGDMVIKSVDVKEAEEKQKKVNEKTTVKDIEKKNKGVKKYA